MSVEALAAETDLQIQVCVAAEETNNEPISVFCFYILSFTLFILFSRMVSTAHDAAFCAVYLDVFISLTV